MLQVQFKMWTPERVFVNLAWEIGERCERQEAGQTQRADYSTQDIKAGEM